MHPYLIPPKMTTDFETRSEADVTKVGAYLYAKHPSTEPLCLGYRNASGSIRGMVKFGEFKWETVKKKHPELAAWVKSKRLIGAHNASFEYYIFNIVLVERYGWPPIEIERFRCTAAKAASHAMPRALEKLLIALKTDFQKDMDGNRHMKKMAKPRPAWKKDPSKPKWFEEPEDFERLYQYCYGDIDGEVAADHMLPELTPDEQQVWFDDFELNDYGIKVDIPTIKLILKLIAQERKCLTQELCDVTDGLVTSGNKIADMQAFLEKHNIFLRDLRANTVKEFLEADGLGMEIPEPVKKVLRLRQTLSLSSIKKYDSFIHNADVEGIVRELLLYHGASTGRYAGRRLQIQNFPRGFIKDVDFALSVVRTGDTELMRLIYGDLFKLFSSLLRSMIIAREGEEIFGVDYAAIEVRVLFWMAGCEKGLKLYRNKEDLYVYQAREIFKNPLLTKADFIERFVGKETVLGSGFGMGAPKFYISCHQKGLNFVTKELAESSISSYRKTFAEVPKMWRLVEEAAIRAVLNKGKAFHACRVKWFCEGRFLYAQLPSGRRLAYADPFLKTETMRWGEKKHVLHFWAVDKNSKWTVEKTWGGNLTENVVQAVSRCLTVDAMRKGKRKGLRPIMSVHDEVVSSAKIGKFTVEQAEAILKDIPAWAKGLPVDAEGFKGPRYRK